MTAPQFSLCCHSYAVSYRTFRDWKACDLSKWIEKSQEPTSFLCVVILMLSHSVPRLLGITKIVFPQNGWKTYEGPPDFFMLSFLCCLVLVHKTLGVHNSNLTSKWVDKLWGLIIFLVSSFLCCLTWYARLLGFTIHPVPQNRWTSYEAYPSFQCHHSGTTIYGMQALSHHDSQCTF
jgi:hypothetical protein